MTRYVNAGTRLNGANQIVVPERSFRGGGVVHEPPADGGLYIMQDGLWVQAPDDGGVYALQPDGFVKAPDDGGLYALQADGFVRVPKIATGEVLITPVADTPTSVAVTFPVGLFDSAPVVMTTAVTSVPGSRVIETSVSSVGLSAAGCEIAIYRTTASDTTVQWMAIEKLPTHAST